MRKLGHGHSLMFFAPLGTDQRIRSLANKGPLDNIDTMDILHWAICETCDEIQQRAPQWAQQGIDHDSRYVAWSRFCERQLALKDLSDKWLQPEAKRLEDLYGPHSTTPSLRATPAIRQRCEALGTLSLRNVGMDEEQEREIIHEAERERQVERPQGVQPVAHSIHQDVVVFVKTGIIPANSLAFRPAFESLDATSAANNEAHIWSQSVWVTMDFEKTVDSPGKMDDFLRPVQWFVSRKTSCKDPVLVILSPHEVSNLMSDIRTSDNVRLHVYTPRVTKFMKPSDDPPLYCIPMLPTGRTVPSPLMDQLNMFAGQLYFKDYETYTRLCRFFCVYTNNPEGEESIEVETGRFTEPRNQPEHLRKNPQAFQSTLHTLKTLIGFRRKGAGFTQTHMGKLLHRRLLSEGDFDGCGDVRPTTFPPLIARLIVIQANYHPSPPPLECGRKMNMILG